MVFYEKFKLIHLFKFIINKKKVFYRVKSKDVQFVEKIFHKYLDTEKIEKLSFGDINIATDIRKNAYNNAQSCLKKIKLGRWSEDISCLFSINIDLIVKKYFFDEFYERFEFYELAIQYAHEKNNEKHFMFAENLFADIYEKKFNRFFKLYFFKNIAPINFIISIALLPLVLKLYFSKRGSSDNLSFTNSIVCNVNGESTYEMFNNIFLNKGDLYFVIARNYIREFSPERLKRLKIHVLGLTKDSYLEFKDYVLRYMVICYKYFKDISFYGHRFLDIYITLLKGKSEIVHGKGNLIFTYEHLITEKATRNEFIRKEGSKTIFVPKNLYATPQYFHSEIFINYDVMCSSGRHIEELYKKKKAITDIFLPVGSYDSHRKNLRLKDKESRIALLKKHKGNSKTVTILSPGICDPTYSHEIKLMNLAVKLAEQNNVKVFIRLKPVPLISKYSEFYHPFSENKPSIMLTAGEYELFDFLDVTDLFITTISNSACDIAVCGGQVMFVDFMKDPDFFLFWKKIDGIVFQEKNAFENIMKWILDKKNGQVRKDHRKAMKNLTDYIGYKFPDFESYKKNILMQLEKNVF